MDYDEIMATRLSTLEARMSALEQRLAVVEKAGGKPPRRRKRELTPEERSAVRARLLAGQERKRQEREAALRAEGQGGKKES